MANWFEPSPEQVAMWNKWVAERPTEVRAIAEKITPWKLYRLHNDDGKPTCRVTLISIQETGSHHTCEAHGVEKHCETTTGPTLTVHVSGRFNLVGFERSVFGITLERLKECDLPDPSEPVGSADLTPDEVALPEAQRTALMFARIQAKRNALG